MAMTTASACPQGTPVPSNAPRTATVARTTGETDIAITIDLDGTGSCSIDTGVPFFDHMLDAFGRHGLFDLAVSATGDVEIDAHHTVEDTGIVLGRAFARALGNKSGITLHVRELAGANSHHIIEAAFKATGRAMRRACEIDPRVSGVPSTKGSL